MIAEHVSTRIMPTSSTTIYACILCTIAESHVSWQMEASNTDARVVGFMLHIPVTTCHLSAASTYFQPDLGLRTSLNGIEEDKHSDISKIRHCFEMIRPEEYMSLNEHA